MHEKFSAPLMYSMRYTCGWIGATIQTTCSKELLQDTAFNYRFVQYTILRSIDTTETCL
jgi:hypothetical protein